MTHEQRTKSLYTMAEYQILYCPLHFNSKDFEINEKIRSAKMLDYNFSSF